MTKEQLFKEFEHIKTDALFISYSLDGIGREIQENCWSISMSDEMARECTVDELLNFLKDVKENRRHQLGAHADEIRLIYYLWIDKQAGQLRFNFINSRHDQLPFKAPLVFVKHEYEVVLDYLNRILVNDHNVLKVYKEIIG